MADPAGRTGTELARRGRVHRHVERVWLYLVCATLALFALAQVRHSPWLLAMAGALVGAGLQSFLPRGGPDQVLLEVQSPPRGIAGTFIQQRVTVTNRGPRPLRDVVVHLCRIGMEDGFARISELAPGEHVSVEVTRLAQARSRFELDVAHLWVGDPLGLIHRHLVTEVPGTVCIWPAPAPPLFLPAANIPDEEGDFTSSLRGGEDLHRVRDWQSGDTMAAVHWRASARHGRLTVVERAKPAVEQVRLALVGRPGHGLDEALLSQAACAVAGAVLAGSEVQLTAWLPGLDAPVEQVAPQGHDQMLDWFSGLVTLATPPTEALTGHGTPVAVLSLTPAAGPVAVTYPPGVIPVGVR